MLITTAWSRGSLSFGAQTIIDVSAFPAGYYVVRVNGLSKTFVKL